MSHSILITGASGYLGGTLLARWAEAKLPAYEKLYALVRTDRQAEAVKQYGAEPLQFDLADETATYKAIVDNKITIVFFLVDAMRSTSQVFMIKALAEVKRATGKDVHFLHTSGAKIFSSHAGATVDEPLMDDNPDLYDIQKSQKPPIPPIQSAIDTNNTVIEQAESVGVKSYIFVPCIVCMSPCSPKMINIAEISMLKQTMAADGKGEGFGNPTSIQTVAIVKGAKAAGGVYTVDPGRPTWPVCHVIDNTKLYLKLLQSILSGDNPDCGKRGYYLAASGSVAWEDLYAKIATALAARDIISSARVEPASETALTEMGTALGCPKELVPLQLGGKCTFTARHGEKIGWKAEYPPSHILDVADEETALTLAHLK